MPLSRQRLVLPAFDASATFVVVRDFTYGGVPQTKDAIFDKALTNLRRLRQLVAWRRIAPVPGTGAPPKKTHLQKLIAAQAAAPPGRTRRNGHAPPPATERRPAPPARDLDLDQALLMESPEELVSLITAPSPAPAPPPAPETPSTAPRSAAKRDRTGKSRKAAHPARAGRSRPKKGRR